MSAKSIPELIHDRIFADGGTLNVWLNGAKFRKMTTAIKARALYSPTEDENMECVTDFEPDPELLTMMKRNAAALRSYRDRVVAEWRAEVEAPRGLGPSESVDRPAPIGRGAASCDCNAEARSAISLKCAPLAVFAAGLVAAAVAGRSGLIPGVNASGAREIGSASEISAANGLIHAEIGPFGRNLQTSSSSRQGEGGWVEAAGGRREVDLCGCTKTEKLRRENHEN